MTVRCALLSLLGVVVAVGLAAVAPVAHAGSAPHKDITVTWPAQTEFNPDTTPYTFQVDDAGGSGNLYVDFDGNFAGEVAIAHTATVTWTFPDQGEGTLQVLRCFTGQGCTVIANSPMLSAYRSVEVVNNFVHGGGPNYKNSFVPGIVGPDERYTVTWQVVRHGTTDVVGEGSDEARRGQGVSFALPEGTPAGSYTLQAHAELATGQSTYGDLVSGDASGGFYWHTKVPDVSVTVSSSTVYPHHDDYLDTVVIKGTPSPPGGFTGRIEVVNSAGTVVYSAAGAVAGFGFDHPPAGTYTVVYAVHDKWHNTSSATTTVRVSDKLLQRRRSVTTFKAADLIGSTTRVGKCSSLVRPSSHGWKGSVGFYSQSKCGGPKDGDAALVLAVEGVYLPHSIDDRYTDFSVDIVGGASRGRHGDGYLVMGYFSSTGDFLDRNQLNARVGNHRGRKAKVSSLVQIVHQRPSIYWQTALAEGSRYDIKEFVVNVGYYRLVSPGAARQARAASTPARGLQVPDGSRRRFAD